MILGIITFGFFVALALWLLRWRKSGWVFAILSLALLWAAGSGLLPGWLGERLQSPYSRRVASEPWGQRNLIILLGGGLVSARGEAEPGIAAYSRIVEAVRLYRFCKAGSVECQILVSGGKLPGQSVSEADVYAAQMRSLGVAASDILSEPDSLNTFANARLSRKIIASKHYDHIVLVTSGLHMRRALLYFAHFGVFPRPSRSDYVRASFSIVPSAANLLLTDRVLHEYEGLLRYPIYNFMGWNQPPERAGRP